MSAMPAAAYPATPFAAPRPGIPGAILPGLVRLAADNEGDFTGPGTNSYLFGDERELLVIDPGPDEDRHLALLEGLIGARRVAAVLLTHSHRDHCALLPKLLSRHPAPLWMGGPDHRPTGLESGMPPARLDPDRILGDGEEVAVAGVRIEIVATPGHCSNHVAIGIAGTPWLLSGDHVMGWSSTVITPPEGEMGAYLASLEKLAARPYAHYLPGHGPAVAEGPARARELLGHRRRRDEQIVAVVKAGARTLPALMSEIYPAIVPGLARGARLTLIAHLEHLAAAGRLRLSGAGPELTVSPE